MRDVFPGYYKPTPDEMDVLWSNALIVLDTNALFNLFRYTNATRSAFLNVLSAKKDRLWIPHQVGLEFQRGRLGIIEDQAQAFTDLISKAKSALANVTKDVGTLRNHPTLDLDELRTTVSTAITTIEQKIEATRKKYESEVVASERHDETTDMITDLYVGKVGTGYSAERMTEVCTTGALRYEAKQPPGYKDAHKPEPDRYGDLLLWLQLLDKAEAESTAVIFVGDDQKEDWWREFKGRKIGPRVELVDEFRARTGKRIYFLTPHGLMELAKKYDDNAVSKDTVQEVAQVSAAQARLMNEAVHGVRPKGYLPNDSEYSGMSTPALELEIRGMNSFRDRRERSLRQRLAEIKELESRGLEESDEYAVAKRALFGARRSVARVSQDLNAAEFELMSRRVAGHRLAAETDDVIIPEPEVIRWLLERSGIPPMGSDSWEDLSDAEIYELLVLAEQHRLPPALQRKLADIRNAAPSLQARWKWVSPPGHGDDPEILDS